MTTKHLWLFWILLGLGLLAHCSPPQTSNPSEEKGWWLDPGPKALVLTMYGETGAFGLIDMQTLQVKPQVGPISNDAIARVWNNYVFVVNRLSHDNIQVMELPSYRLIHQYSVGPRTNPQDIVVVSESKAYISKLAHGKLLVVKPLSGETLGEIDLTYLAETSEQSCQQATDCTSQVCLQGKCAKDGIPELANMILYREHLFVAVQRLDRNKAFLAQDHGKLAVIDTKTDQVIKVLDTQGSNPYMMLAKGHLLYVSQPGNWMRGTDVVLDGLIEVFDMEQLVSKGVVLRETTLGGNIVSFAIRSESQGYVVRSGQDWKTELLRFDPSTGQIGKVLRTSPCLTKGACYSYVGVHLHTDGKLFLVDRDQNLPGIRIFDTQMDQEITTTPLHLGLPPMNVVFLP